jgi:major type 1 subunit fimbrin (pilin)
MLKKGITALALIFVSGTHAVASGDSATITLGGRVLANTCTLDSSALLVELPDINVSDIVSIGSRASQVEIPFLLKGCGADVTAVRVVASGTPDENNTSSFVNAIPTDEGGATGVSVRITMLDGSYPFLPDGSQMQIVQLNPQLPENRFSFFAQYRVNILPVTPGKIMSLVDFRFTYL